jgi:hypothetical protein
MMLRRFGSLLLAAGLTLAAAPAHAAHVPGATYTGTAATGGTISFDVSARGGAVTRFAWRDVPNPNPVCPGTLTGKFTRKVPILEHGFSGGSYMRFLGSFAGNQLAAGALTWSSGPAGGECGSFSTAWTATTTAVAPPPPTSDEIPPEIDFRVRNRLSRGGKLTVWVASPEEACRVTVGGKVSIAGGAETFRLRPVKARLPHGANLPFADLPIEPSLGGLGLAAARRALREGRRVQAKVTVRAVDAAGNRTVERLTVRQRR